MLPKDGYHLENLERMLPLFRRLTRHCDGVDAYLFVNVPAVAVAVVAVAVVVAAAAKGALARALVAAVAALPSVLSPGSCRGASSTPRLVNFSP